MPEETSLANHWLALGLALAFLFLPFFTRIKIGKFLEVEREIERAKEEIHSFKADVRHNLSLLSANISTISGFSNQLTVNLPDSSDIRKARQSIANNAPSELTHSRGEEDLERFLRDEDPTMALAWTRIEIERLLRKIVSVQPHSADNEGDQTRLVGLPKLFRTFLSRQPGFGYMADAFRYVTQICNAAVHAQPVTGEQASEALGLGGQLIIVLRAVAGEGSLPPMEPVGPDFTY